MKTFVTLCAAALISAAATAADQPARNPGDTKEATAKFESLDRNSDQQLSKSEASKDKTLAAQFASADVNGDGYISKSEYAALSSNPRPSSSQGRYQQPPEPYQQPSPDR